MRALFATYETQIKSGKYIFVVKNTIHEKDFKGLKRDFDFALKRLDLLK